MDDVSTLLAGFGWCRTPLHLVEPALAAGQLVPIDIADDVTPADNLTIYAAHRRDRAPERAGRWLLEDLRAWLSVESRTH
ncbi:MAG: hypothetical protein EON54_05115 [Alcaligenaceae bacterium]|nr:MAG: hypothetical protein EON54_05115 [Alcaligenaceae bacterium]